MEKIIYEEKNDKPVFYMMVGIAGSGKSSFTEKIMTKRDSGLYKPVIISSDSLRKELFDDINEQSKNDILFAEMKKRTIENLKQKKNVVYDATNLVKKRRVNLLKEVDVNNCRKVCICIMTPYEECIRQDSLRNKTVGKEVIKRMYLTWTPPHYHEGFDAIIPIFNYGRQNKEDYSLQKLLDMTDIPHDNIYHVGNIKEHLLKAYSYALDMYSDSEVDTACLLHDIGKPFTKSEPDGNGNCHYYCHNNVGAYLAMFFAYSRNYTSDEAIELSNLIYFHMCPNTGWVQSKKAEEKDRQLIGEKMYSNILKIHEADIHAG